MGRVLALAMFAAVVSGRGASSISGNVWDSHGAAVADAEIVAAREPKSAAIETWTDQHGFYALRNLVAGEYTISFAHPNFKRHRQKVSMRDGQSLQLDTQLDQK
jgi:hypothetical protein